jgi:chromosome partitioning protein
MATVIAIANQKGGVAKTTSTFNLAHALVERGQRVLCIDADPQASLTGYFGCDPVDLGEKQKTLYFGLVGENPVPLSTLIIGENPALIPTNIKLAAAEADLRADTTLPAQEALRYQLKEIKDRYDFILIDCQPSLGILPANALAAADLVLVPVETSKMAREGLVDFFDTLRKIRRRLNPEVQVLGILPTKYDSRRNHDNEQLSLIREFGAAQRVTVLEPVRYTTAFDKASDEGRPVSELRSGTNGIENYKHLAEALVARGTNPQQPSI